MTTPSAPAEQRHDSPVRNALTVLFKRRRGMLCVTALALALVAVGTFARRPIYEAKTTILVKYGREYVNRPEVGEDRPLIPMTPEEVLNSEVEILTSEQLAREVIQRVGSAKLYPGLFGGAAAEPEATRQLQKDLKVEAVKRSNILQVAYRHHDPVTASKTLAVVVDVYRQRHLAVFSDTTVHFLESKLAEYQKHLEDAGKKLASFRQEHGVFSFEEQMNLLLRRRAELETAYRQAGVEAGENQRRLQGLQSGLAGPRSPDVRGDIQKDVIRLEAESRSQQSRIAKLAGLLGELDEQIKELDGHEREFATLRREFADSERNYQSYRERVEEMRISSDMNSQQISNISIVDEGGVPTRPVNPRAGLSLGFGIVLSLLTGVGYVLIAERVNQRITTPEAAEKRLDLPVLATISHKE
jgi:uncharacterized protein involved in exopolysaccharide biosynthesis